MVIPDNTLLDMVAASSRAASWRFDLLDKGRQTIQTNLEVNRDAPPQLSVDTSRAMKRTLTGIQFTPGVLDNVNVIQDRVRLTMLLHDGTEWPQGIFLFSDVSVIVISSKQEMTGLTRIQVPTLNLVDQCLIVDQQLDKAIAFGPGTRITDAITLLLAALPIEFVVEPSGAVISATQEAVAWPAGTSRLRVVNELATMIGYHELFFDNDGVGQLHPMPNPETTAEVNTIDYPNAGRVYLGSTTLSTNLLSLPNRFVVLNTGAGPVPIYGLYDVPASAPFSAANYGYIRTHVEDIQGVNSNADAVVAARALARSWRFPYETIEFSGPPDPRHDHYNTLNYEGARYLEMGWTMPCQDGAAMRHSARRTYEAELDEVFAP